jgi:hypothetical protein
MRPRPAPNTQAELPPAAALYLAVSAASTLLAAGRDEGALAVLQGCVDVLPQLHEAGADAATWHAAVAVATFHCNDMQARRACCAGGGALGANGCRMHMPPCVSAHSLDANPPTSTGRL